MAFSEFPDQQQVCSLLQRSLERGRLSHAYLFTGPSMKTLEAVAGSLTRTLNCLQPIRAGDAQSAVDACEECVNCRRIRGFNFPDTQWVRPESKSRVITIDQMREMMQTVHLKPTEGGYKTVVIVGADRLNAQAANAFLKTLEEPPARCVFLLLSNEPERVLETVISRCLRLTFAGEGSSQFTPEEREWIRSFAQAAAQSRGGLMSRYKLLGVVLEQLSSLRSEAEEDLTARSPLQRYEDVDAKLKEKWEDELGAAIEADYRRRRSELIALVEYWMRDVWAVAHGVGTDLLHFQEAEGPSRTIAERITPADARNNLEHLESTQRLLHTNVQEALALEVGLLKLKL